MSLCRWSEHNDVYVYASGDNEWTIHVAMTRIKDPSKIPVIDVEGKTVREILNLMEEVSAVRDMAEREEVPSHFAGQMYRVSPSSLAGTLECIKLSGARVSDDVLRDARDVEHL